MVVGGPPPARCRGACEGAKIAARAPLLQGKLPLRVRLPNLSRLPENLDHLFVVDLRKVRIELPDRLEERGVSRQTTSSAYGRIFSSVSGGATGTAQIRRAGFLRAQRMQRGDHRRPRGQPVVDHDHDAPGRVDRRPQRRVLRAPLPDGVELGLFFLLEIAGVPPADSA